MTYDKKCIPKFQNADNIARHNEPHDLPVEGYSSIDRRRRIEIGQAISYKANRASKASITDERGNGSCK